MIYFYLAAFIFETSMSSVFLPAALLAVEKYHVSSVFLGYMGMVWATSYAVAAVFLGRLADRHNPRVVLSIGCILCAITFSIIPFCPIAGYLPIFLLNGASCALYWPSLISIIGKGKEKSKLVKELGFFSIAWGSGTIIAPVLAGFLYSRDFRLPFILAGVLALLPVFLISRIKTFPAARPEETNPELNHLPSDDKMNRLLYLAWIANFINSFIVGIVRNLFPQFGLVLKFTPTDIGALITLIGVSQTATFLLLMFSTRWLFSGRAIVYSQGLSLLGLYIIIHSTQVGFFAIGFGLLGFGIGVSYFASIIYSIYNRADTGRKSGLHEGILGAGFSTGPWVGGYLAQGFGLRSPYVFSLYFLGLAIMGEFFFLRKQSRAGKELSK